MNSNVQQAFSVELNGVSKKFNGAWVFRNVEAVFEQGKKYAIVGPNGSGKSTLLKIIAGIMTPNEGEVRYDKIDTGHKTQDTRQGGVGEFEIYKEVAFCAPFMELPEELTLAELLDFHGKLRNLSIPASSFTDELQLDSSKEIRHYSSGMKQRLKLALAFFTESKILLLDEPAAALDENWKQWYLAQIEKCCEGRLVVIASNLTAEYEFCDSVLRIADYKK